MTVDNNVTTQNLSTQYNFRENEDELNSLKQLHEIFQFNLPSITDDYFTFLRFQTISGEAEHKKDMIACVDWLKAYMEGMEFDVEIWETSGNPTVFAQNLQAGPEKPTLLIYNHYDVQPVTPVEEWNTPPFEPTIKGDKIYCRGALDDKGQCFYAITAIKTLLERDGQLPVNIKFVIDGEEERGSPGLSAILKDKQEQLSADVVAVIDLGIQKRDVPSITLGIRGIVGFDVSIEGANTDLHSGEFGGIVKNPNQQLAALLTTLHDPETGEVKVPGFYDHVQPLSEEEQQEIDFTFDYKDFCKTYQTLPNGGEKGYSPLERAWIRPTLEINGIVGGTVGSESKTIIPSVSSAHITCRLVPDQVPHAIGSAVSDYLYNQAPKDVKLTVTVRPGIGWPARTDSSSSGVQAFSQAYSKVFGKPCDYQMAGGTISIASQLKNVSKGTLVLMGLGLPGDNMHAPNESFDFGRFEMGVLIVAEAITNLGVPK